MFVVDKTLDNISIELKTNDSSRVLKWIKIKGDLN